MIDDQVLRKLLLENGTVTENSLERAATNAKNKGISLHDSVLEDDLLSEENLGKLLSEYYQIPLVILSKTKIDDSLFRLVPEIVARKQHVFLYGGNKDGLLLATDDPEKQDVFRFIAKKVGGPLQITLTTTHELERAFGYYKSDVSERLAKILAEYRDNPQGSDAPVTEILQMIIEYAFTNHASDIHIEPEKKDTFIRFRIDGVLHDVMKIPQDLHQQLVTRVKVACGLKTDEHVSSQDGKMQSKYGDEDIDIRVSIVPITTGEKAVLRLLSSRARRFSLTDLGMKDNDLKKVRAAFDKPFGMVLATGPTGSGKTTTIYSILKIINRRDVNIATIEDPVEYEIGGVSQIQVNPNTNLTFADGLKAILRQDPNVIFVGEIRDEETAGIAVNAATTGHLVLSTLHTNNAATTLPRLLDMNSEPYLIATTVNAIIGQRLVRRVCDSCRTSREIDSMEIKARVPKKIFDHFFGKSSKIRSYFGSGCAICQHTGYIGRVGIFEILVMTDKIRDLIVAKATAEQIESQAIDDGMTTMISDGLLKMQEGVTTLEEVLRATKE